MKGNVKVWIILAVLAFGLIAFGFTGLAIAKKQKSLNFESEIVSTTINNTTKPKNEKTIDFNDLYDENDLKTYAINITFEDRECRVYQIDGLKDKDVENKINKDIVDEINRVYAKFKEEQKDKENMVIKGFECYPRGNFSNIFSIWGNFSFYDKDAKDGDYNSKYPYVFFTMTYNLNDGSRLKLEDIFKENANVNMCIASAISDVLTIENNADFENEWFNEHKDFYVEPSTWPSITPSEEEVYNLVLKYLKGDKLFFVDNTYVTIFFESYTSGKYRQLRGEIRYASFPDEFVIYSKYLSKDSLYENSDIAIKDIMVCSEKDNKTQEYGYALDNMWYDICMYGLDYNRMSELRYNKYEEFLNNKKLEVKECMKEIVEMAKKDPNNFYYYRAYPFVYPMTATKDNTYMSRYSDFLEYKYRYELYVIPNELLETKYKNLIYNMYVSHQFPLTYIREGNSQYDELISKGGKYVNEELPYDIYNFVTGKMVTDIYELYDKDSADMQRVRSEILSRLYNIEGVSYSYDENGKYISTPEKAREFLDKVKFEIYNGYVIAKIDELPTFEMDFLLLTFDVKNIKTLDP